ncbi:MAG: TIGR02996 domain-containing protein [Gemmataceae bacterium]
MTYEDPFLDDILAQPDEDVPRLLFADWLLDQPGPGQVARGEFIHLQCLLARQAPGGLRPSDHLSRERAYLEEYSRTWGTPFQRLGCTCWEFRRGFVEGVALPASVLLEHHRTLFRMGPLRELRLTRCAGLVRSLAQIPQLGNVEILDLENNFLDDHAFEELFASPYLTRVRTLLLWSNRMADHGMEALTQARMPGLTRLDLSHNQIGDEGALTLANSELLGRLALLDLTANRITDTGALALASSPYAASLGWIDLSKNHISQATQSILRERLAGRVQVWG